MMSVRSMLATCLTVLTLLMAPLLGAAAQGPRQQAAGADPSAAIITSAPVPEIPPSIDAVVGADEWDGAMQVTLDSGKLLAFSDCTFLYLLIDVMADTEDEGITADLFQLSFDVDQNGAVTPEKDVLFSTHARTGALCRSFYLSDDSFSLCQSPDSVMARGFGPSRNSRTAHRFWELAMGAEPGRVRCENDHPGADRCPCPRDWRPATDTEQQEVKDRHSPSLREELVKHLTLAKVV